MKQISPLTAQTTYLLLIFMTRDWYFENLGRIFKLTHQFEWTIQNCKEQLKIYSEIPNFYGNFSKLNQTLDDLVSCKVYSVIVIVIVIVIMKCIVTIKLRLAVIKVVWQKIPFPLKFLNYKKRPKPEVLLLQNKTNDFMSDLNHNSLSSFNKPKGQHT